MLTRQPARPKCTSCNISFAKPNGISKHGFQKWHKYCVDCAKALYNKKIPKKNTMCIECGFIPKDLIQLDVAYRDLDSTNKNPQNILTVCANCSRLRRKMIREGKKQMEMSVDSTIRI